MLKPTLSYIFALAILNSAPVWAAAPEAKPDLEKAKQTAETVCLACHGTAGASTNPEFPKLAGQHWEYTYKQLRQFKSWNGKAAERENAVMAGMSAPLEDADMKALAHYFAAQKPSQGEAKSRATVELGQRIWRAGIAAKGVPACAACHGPAGAGLPSQYPRLQGQHAKYTESQLRLFRDGKRANDPNKMMRTIALKMTDPEIAAVADYIAGLR